MVDHLIFLVLVKRFQILKKILRWNRFGL